MKFYLYLFLDIGGLFGKLLFYWSDPLWMFNYLLGSPLLSLNDLSSGTLWPVSQLRISAETYSFACVYMLIETLLLDSEFRGIRGILYGMSFRLFIILFLLRILLFTDSDVILKELRHWTVFWLTCLCRFIVCLLCMKVEVQPFVLLCVFIVSSLPQGKRVWRAIVRWVSKVA